jgi:hypothetical protein
VVVMVTVGIGATFWIEGGIDDLYARAKAPRHILDHMIAADQQTITVEHSRQVAIAKMPGDPHQMAQIRATNFSQRLWCGLDEDVTSIIQNQSITILQSRGAFKIEQEIEPTGGPHRDPSPMATVEVQYDGVGHLCGA